MRAARKFVMELAKKRLLPKVAYVKVDLFGSLAMTGKGHRTDVAIILGLLGETPEGIDPTAMEGMIAQVQGAGSLKLLDGSPIPFVEGEHLVFRKGESLPSHPNGMYFQAFDADDGLLLAEEVYSVGGGFIVSAADAEKDVLIISKNKAPYPFKTCGELLHWCNKKDKRIADVVWANERKWRSKDEIHKGLLRIWSEMDGSIERGCHTPGILPGGLNVRRRAPGLYRTLTSQDADLLRLPGREMDLVSAYAIAVNEENAAGGRVVTAPTNGAAGTIPAVLKYYLQFSDNASEEKIVEFLLVAAAVGILYKEGASISAAEVGCQGEVGVACSMAAAGLASVLGGSNAQIEDAAEIGMEHNLGLTCDPVMGLVQIPCIERNAMGAVKAITAARLALRGDARHKVVSLDAVIRTMRNTGRDMQSIYKETSEGGLAVNVPEC